MRRAVALIVLLVALSAAPAFGQTNPFTPPQPVVPTPTPELVVPEATPIPTPTPPDEDPDRTLLFGIAGLVALTFTGIGIYITRDARKSLTEADRRALDRERAGAAMPELTPEQKREARRRKEQARAKTKAQKRARKVQRGKR